MNINFENHGGNIEKEARKLGLSTENIIDASASIVPFKLPKKLNNYLINSIKNRSIRSYPDRSYFYFHGSSDPIASLIFLNPCFSI